MTVDIVSMRVEDSVAIANNCVAVSVSVGVSASEVGVGVTVEEGVAIADSKIAI